MGGGNIERILIVESNERNSSVMDEVIEVLKRHSDFEILRLKHKPVLSLSGLEIDPAHRKVYCGNQEILIIFQVFPEMIVNLFGQESELYMEFAVKCFRVYLAACFMIPSSMVISIFFQAIGKPVPAMALSLSRQVVFLLPALFILGSIGGIDWLLRAGPTADTHAGIVSLITVRAYWKKIFGKSEVKVNG